MRSSIALFLAIIVASMLAVSAFTHIENSFHFLHTIYSYQIVGQRIGIAAAAIMPFVQLLLAVVLLFDARGRRMAFAGSTILFAVYTAAQVSAKYRDLNISCGCFGGSDENPIGPASIGLAAGTMIASIMGWWLSKPVVTK